ncbi:hypothetical protein BOTBODRAFT_188839 [Botryobasidium botryosum FD-172 SS1]|uniref:Oxo-4-hydroxy-4-carboxy-5-ureidoimidazoline decarboxylase domain-containing protein n=1 Tax=Botryobasidium botryosum (strain FD-172 SS1) TaxID=930990 RepID=A0A067MBD3_BOTB1|nr:hypothetical protein BOTBODRAFT_188839 [Botryobasidium botryosum FD-172 SS1]
MAAIPPLSSVLRSSEEPDSPLAHALSVLFEPSPALLHILTPRLRSDLVLESANPPSSYSGLIDRTLTLISAWGDDAKAGFISGHPRIGEVKNLSKLSEREQAAVATPPEVLRRLEHLNACYERKYPGLRYITFVNGRTRAQIVPEIEGKLGIEHSLDGDQPPLESIAPLVEGSHEWKEELERAIADIGLIAKSRLKNLGVD